MMGKRNRWLFALWVREWDYWEKELAKHLRMELACLVAYFLFFVVNKSFLDSIQTRLLEMPREVCAFWGITGSAGAGSPFFSMRWALMPLNVWVAWDTCRYALRVIWREEREGSIFILCNQWYSRYQLGIAKYTWSVVNFIIRYTVLFAVYAALLLLGNGNDPRFWKELEHTAVLFIKGIVVMVLLISVCCSHAMLHAEKIRSFWADGVVFGLLAAGNFYKLVDLSALWIKRQGRDYIGMIRWLSWTDRLYWLSPLSWLNSFAEHGIKQSAVQLAIGICVSGAAAALGLLGYRVRSFNRYGRYEMER